MRTTFIVALALAALAATQVSETDAPAADCPAAAAESIAVPALMSFQGRLLDSAGTPVPDTLRTVRFRLYDRPTGGTRLWEEDQSVRTRDGLFAVLLGSVTPIPSVPEAGGLYLGMQVEAEPEMDPRTRIVSAAYAYLARKADTARYAESTAGGDNAWTRGTPDSVLFTTKQLGIARGGALNVLNGGGRHTHVNLGVASTTGTSGLDHTGSTVGGGFANTAGDDCATVAGGRANHAIASNATVAGGQGNSATAGSATVGGGRHNVASGTNATISGGKFGTASGYCAAVGGGVDNVARDECATVAGGAGNTAIADRAAIGGGAANIAGALCATIAGGNANTASDTNAAIGGGQANVASGRAATVPGGEADTCAGDWGLATGYRVRVGDSADYTLAFGEDFVTNTIRAVVFYHSGGATRLGVGRPDPAYQIHCGGGAYCTGTDWVNGSSRESRQDVTGLTGEQLRRLVEELRDVEVVRYRNRTGDTDEEHIGIAAENAPATVATPTGDGINTGDAIGWLVAIAQAQQREIDLLKTELVRLRR